MKSKFGFLVQLDFLQTFVSKFISKLNPAVVHNVEKYIALKKVSFLTSIESIDGDYLEFGVFEEAHLVTPFGLGIVTNIYQIIKP